MGLEHHLKILTIEGFSAWTQTLLAEGRKVYFVNFMFKHLSKRPSIFTDQMEDEVYRIYQTLATRVVRNPRKNPDALPIYFGCPDFPVWKLNKVSSVDSTVNDGKHWNGLYFMPPASRLRCGLGKHFQQNRKLYIKPDHPLQRIHATWMTYGNMTDYTLKALKSGRISHDDILILPRAVSELDNQNDYRYLKSL